MQIRGSASLVKRSNADILVVPFFQEKGHPSPAFDVQPVKKALATVLSTKDFSGKHGEALLCYADGGPEKRLLLLGLGDKELLTVEKLRRAYAQVTKECRKKKLAKVNILVPVCEAMITTEIVSGIADGLFLSNYSYATLKRSTLQEEKTQGLEVVHFIGAGKKETDAAEHSAVVAEGVYLARDLVNGNADDITPQYLSAVARGLEKTFKHVKTTVFDKERITKENMGLLLAVNRGSHLDPAFIIIEYKGAPKSADKTVIVGKGITFDTGGLNLKATGAIETMKCDMSGAAAILGVMHVIASLELPINVTGVVASTENAVDAKSYKPGDVYVGYAGKSVEIGNTDAEGRLVLADALAYSVDKLKPSRIIDLATLTGAVEIALGDEASGLMGNNDALADALIHAGSESGELLWRLPIYEEYREKLKSDIADIKSTGGRPGSALKAASFLQEFVGKTVPWAHLDIAGTAFLSEEKRYLPKYATGVGVRLLTKFFESL